MEMEKRFKLAVNRTWDAIGSDILSAYEREGMEPELDKATVSEVVRDASNLEAHGNDKEAVAWFRKLSWVEQDEVMNRVLTFDTYGW